jgi:eukaryotic-like serine/threonine-protein kinase
VACVIREDALVAGDVLADRYCLLRRLGEGASGCVWLARDDTLDICVAVKVLRAELATRAGALERFSREGEFSERMLSPNIVKVLARKVTRDKTPIIVFEHLEGEDLATRTARVRRLPIGEVLMVILHACRALARIHAVGILHRDVKPENLFWTTDAEGRPIVKLLDLGVADLVARPTEAGSLVGTFEYMAPEVLLAERVPDERSDLYSMGVVAYECLTGAVPFSGPSVGDLVLGVTSGEIPQASASRDDLPTSVDDWFLRALARQPEDRFSSAKEMSAAFQAVFDTGSSGVVKRQVTTAAPNQRLPIVLFEDERPSQRYRIIHGREVATSEEPPTPEELGPRRRDRGDRS